MRPKKLAFVNGKRVLVEHDSRKEEDREYNKTRWKHQRELMSFYNSKAWRTMSKLTLNAEYYVCRMCGDDATLADHIVPVRVNWSLRLIGTNLQPLCSECHAIKTKEDEKRYNIQI